MLILSSLEGGESGISQVCVSGRFYLLWFCPGSFDSSGTGSCQALSWLCHLEFSLLSKCGIPECVAHSCLVGIRDFLRMQHRWGLSKSTGVSSPAAHTQTQWYSLPSCSQGSEHNWIMHRAEEGMFNIASTTIFILFLEGHSILHLLTFSICCSSVPSLWSLLCWSIWFVIVLSVLPAFFVLHVFKHNTWYSLDIFKKSTDAIKCIHIFC